MKQLIGLIVLLLLPYWMKAAELRCNSCGKFAPRLLTLQTLTGEKKMVCAKCYYLVPRCGICRLPIVNGGKRLDDGRAICEADFNAGIFSQQDAEDILRQTQRELSRVFYRFSMVFPETNVTISLVGADRLYELAGIPYDPSMPEMEGLTKPSFYGERGEELDDDDVRLKRKKPSTVHYNIFVLAGLPRARLTSVCAHEYAHVWHFANLKLDRSLNLERKTREAFCELVAYQLMSSMNEDLEKAVIEANLYTYGQARLLIEVEKDYGFNRILEWMKNGLDLNLSREDLDRIRVTSPAAVAPQTTAPILPASFAIVDRPAPDTLMLKGIVGGNRKFALINNQTLGPAESAKVKIGTTNVLVHVLEIRTNSVLIRTNDTAEPQEIFLNY